MKRYKVYCVIGRTKEAHVVMVKLMAKDEEDASKKAIEDVIKHITVYDVEMVKSD